MDDFYIMQKKVDKSVLCQGMTIPQVFTKYSIKKLVFDRDTGSPPRFK